VSRGLLLGRKRCTAEITVATRSLLPRAARGETVWCLEEEGHEVTVNPTNHRGVATQLKRRPLTVIWEVNRWGHAVLLAPDNLVEVS
jgi:hypothetical protein